MSQLMDIDDKDRQDEVTLLLSYLKATSSSVMCPAAAETLDEILERVAEASRQLVRAQASAVAR